MGGNLLGMDFCLELMGFGTFVRKVTVKGTSFLHVLYFTSGLGERQARSVYEKVIIEMDGQKKYMLYNKRKWNI